MSLYLLRRDIAFEERTVVLLQFAALQFLLLSLLGKFYLLLFQHLLFELGFVCILLLYLFQRVCV